MCYCNPLVKTPVCGSPMCFPREQSTRATLPTFGWMRGARRAPLSDGDMGILRRVVDHMANEQGIVLQAEIYAVLRDAMPAVLEEISQLRATGAK